MQGWIRIYRAIVESDIYFMPPLYSRVFERLLIEANHKDNEIPFKQYGSKVTTKKLIGRGERLTSIRTICEWVGWYEYGIFKKPNPKTIKEILDWLVLNNMIEIYPNESNRDGTHYKIVNYNVYQNTDEEEVTVSKQSVNSKETVTTSKQECIKNVKNVKEVKIKYREFVKMTKTEYDKLITEHGEAFTNTMLDRLDNYKGSTGKKYASDYRTILNWIAKDKGVPQKGETNGNSTGNDNPYSKYTQQFTDND